MNFSRRMWVVALLFVFGATVFLSVSVWRDVSSLRVIFLDVGQGDAILLSSGSNQLLIDTGKNGRALLSGLGEYVPFWDRTIEMVLLTHPDQDHIGALPDLLDRYRVSLLLSADIPEETAVGRAVRTSVESHRIRRIAPFRGLSVTIGPGVTLETIFPEIEMPFRPKYTNESSVVALLSVGADSFLFTGDLPKEEIVLPERDIRVLKVSHHGSKYSTSDVFLDRMKPEEAVISVGKNSYGHPAPEVLDRLGRRGIRTFRTDMSGAIVYECPLAEKTSCSLIRPRL